MHPDPRVLSTLLCGRPLSQRDAADATPDAALADALPLALAPGRLDAAVCYVVGSKY